MEISVGQFLIQASRSLSQVSETPSLDAQVLLSHFLEKPRSWVLAHSEAILNDQQYADVAQALDRLQHGEPLPYVISHWEFYGLDFKLTPDVLIPRPETELLVERALIWLQHHPAAKQVIDVGAGSGCIGITLAMNNPHIHVLLTDISLPALKVAMTNGSRYGLSDRLKFQQADLLQGVTGLFDLLCANLPYIPRGVLPDLPVAEKEPSLALNGGQRGLELITKLLDQSRDHLALGGMMLLEIESSQGSEVLNTTRDFFPASKVLVLKDLSGYDRCVEITTSSLIAHLCQHEEWHRAQELRIFADQSLHQQGFIHCSRPDQLLEVANRYYRGKPTLKVLWIDPGKVSCEIRWETADAASFPHIYGPIDLTAVVAATDIQPDTDGYYRHITIPN